MVVLTRSVYNILDLVIVQGMCITTVELLKTEGIGKGEEKWLKLISIKKYCFDQIVQEKFCNSLFQSINFQNFVYNHDFW